MEYAEGHGFWNHIVGKLRDHDHIRHTHDAGSKDNLSAADDKTLVVEQSIAIQTDPQTIWIGYYHTHVQIINGRRTYSYWAHKTLAQYALLACVIPGGNGYDITKYRFKSVAGHKGQLRFIHKALHVDVHIDQDLGTNLRFLSKQHFAHVAVT